MPKFNNVYIRDVELRAPGLARASELLRLPLDWTQDFLDAERKGRRATLQTGSAKVSLDSPFYPRRADLKTMREETICAVDACGELLARAGLSESDKEQASLYATTSLSHGQTQADIDDILLHLASAQSLTVEERNKLLMRKLHPLFGLKALTNAAESFVAQHSQVKGENATFGDTASAGYNAFLASCWDLQEHRTPFALSVGTNCGGFYTALAHESYWPEATVIRESSAAVAVLLSTQPGGAPWKISELSTEQPQGSFDHVISSSAYHEAACENLRKSYSSIGNVVSSYFSWGSLGAASFHFSLARAFPLATSRRVLLVEEDPFGVKSFLVLERTS